MLIELSPPDANWPATFAQERDRVKQALGDLAVEIEHIGSTSVPGLAAKPVIDIQVGVASLGKFEEEAGIKRLEQLGYEYLAHFEDMVPFRRLFTRTKGSVRLNNLHLVAIDHPWWRRHILFRDYLRQNPAAQDRYEQVKRELAHREWQDVNDYAGAKTAVVSELEEQAFEHFGLSDQERTWVRSSRI
jgi:GrpB-like predicted nucleotidyltransferase (UPF0157 family)